MKKTLLLITLLAVIGAAAAGYFFYLAPRTEQAYYVTEAALPAAPGADYTVVLKLTDTNFLKSLVTGISSLVSEFPTLPDGENRLNTSSNIVSTLNGFNALLDTVTEISILAEPQTPQGAVPSIYISMLADGTAFSRVMEDSPGGFFTVEKWDAGIANSEGWTIKNPSGSAMYLLKRPGAEKSQILAGGTEQAISSMLSAADGKSPRFSFERATSGDSFFQVRLKDGFTYGMLGKMIAGITAASTPKLNIDRFFAENNDRVLFTVYEYSVAKNEKVLTFESYSDSFEKNPELAARRPKSAVVPRLMGDGELAYFLAFDTGLILSAIFPGTDDPAQMAFKLLGEDFMFSSDLKAILSSARISIACAVKDKKLNTVYALLETDAPESLNKLYSMIGFLGLPSGELQGWDSAISTPIPYSAVLERNAVLAHAKGAFLAGIGTIDDFAKNPAVREEYREFLSPDNVVSCIVSSKMYDMLIDTMQSLISIMPNGTYGVDEETSIAVMAAIRDSFDFACGRADTSGRGYGKYAFSSEDGNIFEAIFKALSLSAKRMTGGADVGMRMR
ncbi:MAG: hypothetical protein LBS53_08725 [Synergistaceae bacterium]|jgi:hypothetical protein|nr:hypothetical protein [Synergistaceae bacterium]